MSQRVIAPLFLLTWLAFSAAAGCGGSPNHEPLQKDGGASQIADASSELDGDLTPDPADASEPEGDVSEDASVDAATCPAELPADACGLCGGDGSSCRHALAGTYAARTQFYSRQRTSLEDSAIDLVSKGVLLSLVDIDERGVAEEHYCFLEITSDEGVVSWTTPATLQRVPNSLVQLEEKESRFVRPLAAHRGYFSWSPGTAPADCVAGQVHTSGCLCPTGDALPTRADDCRVTDIEQDGKPGGKMYLSLGELEDINSTEALIGLNVVALLNLEWRLQSKDDTHLVGAIQGGIEQTELSREGELSGAFGSIKNAMCADAAGNTLGHVELVRGEFTCASLLAGRATDKQSYNIFADELDVEAPAVDSCPNPDCQTDSDGDGRIDCEETCPADPLKTAPGLCGCSVADLDSDLDGTPNCDDTCPNDATKVAPLACGCAVAETNGDADGAPDCIDECDADPLKVAPGACGCGVADTNSDGDSAPNCNETCDNDPTKLAPGACGCGTPDTNSDGDAVPNCNDACPNDATKTTLGLCGCGVAETNSDGDSAPDCTDQCDNDPAKTLSGACGCGVAETNSDADGAPDCIDQCDSDVNKTVPGTCGCGVADTDGDGDGTPNCNDGCPQHAGKRAPGVCGCATPETNSDGDSQPDCLDQCDADPGKTVPGTCGCGVADADLNGDGSIDCADLCPADPAKVAPGQCGCGTPDTNTDGDALPNCTDQCPTNPAKVLAGQCGCVTADVDPDGDGVASCNDACPNDPAKTTIGSCGCGVAETNTDGDSQPDCIDQCDADASKTAPGSCGCGVAETNTDGDSQPDCIDQCDADASKTAPGSCGCGVLETNTDGDSQPDCIDQCDADASKTAPGSCGCGVLETNTDGDSQPDCIDQCDANPNKVAPGACGCNDCPLLGTYAVRSSVYSKARNGTAITTSKALSYSFVTVSEQGGVLRLTDRKCWTQTIPNPDPEEDGTKIYSWSKPAWVQATPSVQRDLVLNSNGTVTRPSVLTRLGWDPARQPSTCSANSTPLAPWSWGSTCRCTAPADALPPYDTDASGFDCRLVDTDSDGQPGISINVSTAPPGSPAADPPSLGGTAYGVSNSRDSWTITPAANGRHTATIADTSTAMLVGCTGIACFGLSSSPVASVSCPQPLNRAQFVPVAANFNCGSIISQRDTLFATNQDGEWPTTATCSAP